MTGSILDADAGTLALSGAALDAVQRNDPSVESLEELRAAGIVTEAGFHPEIEPILEVIREPDVRITLRMLHPQAAGCGAWAQDEVVVMALPRANEELFDIVAIPASSFALHVARLVEFGPREARSPLTLTLRSGVLEALLHGGPANEPPLDDAVSRARPILSQMRGRWMVDAVGDATGRSLHVVDCGPEGLWIVQAEGEQEVLTRVSPTDVWRLLTSLLIAL